MTRAERLGKRGIVFVEVDGLLARLTVKQSAAAVDDPARFLRATRAVAFAAPLALHMRRRVRDERKVASGVWSGYARRSSVVMTRAYADRAGLPKTWYRSSADMHAALPGSERLFSVTGGMWDGLQVRGSGNDRAIIDFAGTSVGKGTTQVTRRRGGQPVLVTKPANVRNSAKARSIFDQRDVHILEPADAELVAMTEALVQSLAERQADAWGAEVRSVSSAGDRSLVESIMAALQGQRPMGV